MTNNNKMQIEWIKKQVKDSIETKKKVMEDIVILKQINKIVYEVCCSLKDGNKIIFAGNGGSFADAQHLSAEFVSRFRIDRDPLSSVVLGANNSAISAIGNDYGYDRVFSRELQAIYKKGDVYIPITTSGNSLNIINSVEFAKRNNIKTFGFTGQGGGLLKNLCECVCIPSTDTARIQECHIMIGHILCELVENYFITIKNKC